VITEQARRALEFDAFGVIVFKPDLLVCPRVWANGGQTRLNRIHIRRCTTAEHPAPTVSSAAKWNYAAAN
jgi:hypothetical protein